MNTMGFIGLGHYGRVLAEGMFGSLHECAVVPMRVILYDRDAVKAEAVAAKLGTQATVANCAAEVLEASEIVVLGVPSEEISTLASCAIEHMSDGGRNAIVVMDGIDIKAIRGECPGLPIGAVMFNFFTQYRSGIVGFWPGDISPNNTSLLKRCLSPLGTLWIADNIETLSAIRATAGLGVGLIAHLLMAIRDGMPASDLSADRCEVIVRSLLEGMVRHVAHEGSLESALEATASRQTDLMETVLRDVSARGLDDPDAWENLFAAASQRCRDLR